MRNRLILWVKGMPGLLNSEEEARMEKKFFLRGYNEVANLPVFYDDETYSLEEASLKAKEYLLEKGLLTKIIIYEQDQDNGEEEKATKFICRNKYGKLEEFGYLRR